MEDRIIFSDDPEAFAEAAKEGGASRVALEGGPETMQGLAKLVLTLVELLRQLLERQALNRMERGTLTDEEIDRIGEALLRLDEKMDELCAVFGLDRSELNVDLGPLGNIL